MSEQRINTFVVVRTAEDDLIVVCKLDNGGYELRGYKQPPGFKRWHTPLSEFGEPTAVSARIGQGSSDSFHWLKNLFYPEQKTMLNDDQLGYIGDINDDVLRAMRSLRDVQTT